MRIVVPVTPLLAAALEGAEAYLARLDTSSGKDEPKIDGTLVKDRLHFEEAVGVLEKLVHALLSGMAAAPLSGPQPLGARVTFTSDDSLNAQLFSSVDYLRDDASKTLEAGRDSWNKWGCDLTRVTQDELKRLYSKINSSIQVSAKADLSALQDKGVSFLLDAATALSKAVADSERGAQAEEIPASGMTAAQNYGD